MKKFNTEIKRLERLDRKIDEKDAKIKNLKTENTMLIDKIEHKNTKIEELTVYEILVKNESIIPVEIVEKFVAKQRPPICEDFSNEEKRM
ncbi:hypothetical protein C2G38_2075733 [Gigaspora rosea]|uniref:Uncharacterized protein n=1 Tax=Gigaspora rosea TaxID=44941 RepID=A0A397VR20_9GLOM|nr:hypothetical protein C2G38_2075733 [Gigaspora rosea]